MEITPKQLRLIHLAHRQAGLNDQQYRMLLRNVARVESAKELSQAGFEDVMAMLEERGFQDTLHAPDYWRKKAESRGHWIGDRMVHKAKALAAQTRYDLAALCQRFSDGRTGSVAALTPREGWNLVNMLNDVVKREGSRKMNGIASDAQCQQGDLFATV